MITLNWPKIEEITLIVTTPRIDSSITTVVTTLYDFEKWLDNNHRKRNNKRANSFY